MKNNPRRKAVPVLLALASLVLVLFFVPQAYAAKAKLSANKATLVKGQTLKLKVKNYKKTVKWKTSNKKVATVKKGKVKAVKKGKATITAKAGSAKLKCKITVETPKLSKKKASVEVGESLTLKLKGTTKKIKWTSDKPDVASVSKGKVEALSPGTARITALYLKKKYTCTVTVKDVDLQRKVKKSVTATDGKIALITNTKSQGVEEYSSAELMVKKYGSDRIVHDTIPENFMAEQKEFTEIVNKYGSDPDFKAIIINQACPGTDAAIDKVLKSRKKKDLLIIYCTPQENADDVTKRADMILAIDEIGKGTDIAQQAYNMGCKTFVHYSFPRHMEQLTLAQCRDNIKKKCKELGIKFIDAEAEDPVGPEGLDAALDFITEDVPAKVKKYGADTCFFATNCALQTPLIKAVHDTKAYYALPCCPSPYHGFPDALGIKMPEDPAAGLETTIKAIGAKLKKDGLEGHFSTWRIPVSISNTVAATEYAFLWMNGKAGKCDKDVIQALIADYCGADVKLSSFKFSGKTYDNYLIYRQDFLNFGEPTRKR